MYLIYDEDLIIGISEYKIFNSIEFDGDINEIDIDVLRVDKNGNVVNVTDYNEFYIDKEGNKHIYQDEENTRQLLQCKWNDILQQDENGNWFVYTLEKAKEDKLLELYNYRKELENKGIYIDNYFVDTSETGRLNLSNTINAYEWGLLDKTQTINWKIRSGEFVQVGYDLLKVFAKYVAYYIETLFSIEKYHSDNIKFLTSVEDVNNYDITINWISNQFSLNTNGG